MKNFNTNSSFLSVKKETEKIERRKLEKKFKKYLTEDKFKMQNQIEKMKKFQEEEENYYNDYEFNDEDEKEEEDNDNEINHEEYCIINANNGVNMAIENGFTTVFIKNIPYLCKHFIL